MNEPEYGTPEWHQHVLDSLHDETGVRVHHDRMDFPGGHTFPVLRPHVTVNDNFNHNVHATIVSEHIFPRRFLIDKYINSNNVHHHLLYLFHNNDENEHNDVEYSTEHPNPNLLHPEQFGLEVQKRLRTVQDPPANKSTNEYLMETFKKRS
jgi:hypothetical protein